MKFRLCFVLALLPLLGLQQSQLLQSLHDDHVATQHQQALTQHSCSVCQAYDDVRVQTKGTTQRSEKNNATLMRSRTVQTPSHIVARIFVATQPLPDSFRCAPPRPKPKHL